MRVNGIVKIVKDATKQRSLEGAKIGLYIGQKELAVLYSDREGRFEYEEAAQYIDELLICRVEKEGLESQEGIYEIERDEIRVEIELKEPDLLDYLPAIYQEQAEKEGHPLRALLIMFEHCFSELEKKIDNIDIYFDPLRTPAKWDRDFLSWLASWVVLELDEGWLEEKSRPLIKDAAELYKLRGTRKGLERIIKRFFDIDVEIKEWEWPYGMAIGVRSSIGVDTIIEGIDANQCFIVTCKSADPALDETEFIKKMSDPGLIEKIRTLIDLEKPAHTQYYLELPKERVPEEVKFKIQPMFIGVNSTIGFCYIGGV